MDIYDRARSDEDFDALVEEYSDDTGAGVYGMANKGQEADKARSIYPRGDMADPLTRKEIVTKFRLSAENLLDPNDTERAIDMLVNIAELPRVSDLCAVLSRVARAAAA